jgi:hypothetical protein
MKKSRLMENQIAAFSKKSKVRLLNLKIFASIFINSAVVRKRGAIKPLSKTKTTLN